ncbi:MAG: hypothetical protein AAF573_23095 [Bacteroidota bacterium]
MKAKKAAPTNKNAKRKEARKKAEAQKAVKKAVRMAKGNAAPSGNARKGKSSVPQSKSGKRK